jgi:hypothetical protein
MNENAYIDENYQKSLLGVDPSGNLRRLVVDETTGALKVQVINGGGGGDVTIGNAVIGGTPNKVLFIDSASNLAQADEFGFYDDKVFTNLNQVSAFERLSTATGPSLIMGTNEGTATFQLNSVGNFIAFGKVSNTSHIIPESESLTFGSTDNDATITNNKTSLVFGEAGGGTGVLGQTAIVNNAKISYIQAQAITGGLIKNDGLNCFLRGIASGDDASSFISTLYTAGESSQVNGKATDGGSISAFGTRSKAYGFAGAKNTLTAIRSEIESVGDDSYAEGIVNDGGKISAQGTYSISRGVVSSLGDITTIDVFSKAEGVVDTGGSIQGNNISSSASGFSSGIDNTSRVSTISANGVASTSRGKVLTGGLINAGGDGTYAGGYILSNDPVEQASIQANGNGDFAFGYADTGGKILAQGGGASARGIAFNSNSIIAYGQGSQSSGASNTGNVISYGIGGMTHGDNIITDASYAFAWGRNGLNEGNNSFLFAFQGNGTLNNLVQNETFAIMGSGKMFFSASSVGLLSDSLAGGGERNLKVDNDGLISKGTPVANNVQKFYVQQALANGVNSITHSFNLSTPKAIQVQVYNDATGTPVAFTLGSYTLNGVSITVVGAVTLANIIITG